MTKDRSGSSSARPRVRWTDPSPESIAIAALQEKELLLKKKKHRQRLVVESVSAIIVAGLLSSFQETALQFAALLAMMLGAVTCVIYDRYFGDSAAGGVPLLAVTYIAGLLLVVLSLVVYALAFFIPVPLWLGLVLLGIPSVVIVGIVLFLFSH